MKLNQVIAIEKGTKSRALQELTEALAKLFDVVATKDWANCQAKADVVVDGNEI